MLGMEIEIYHLLVPVLNVYLSGFSMAKDFVYRPNSSASCRLMECSFIGFQNGVEMKTNYDILIIADDNTVQHNIWSFFSGELVLTYSGRLL